MSRAVRPAPEPRAPGGERVTLDLVQALPKVALHDHLDGGLRPATVIEHCLANGHEPPTRDPAALADWFHQQASAGDLVGYLRTFDQTIAAMQTREQLVRVAAEFVEDQASDGVVYAEARWAPEQHLRQGLTLDSAVEAVRDGLAEGMAAVRAAGGEIVARQIVTSMRHAEPTVAVADLAVRHRDDSVCGFDLAGAEDGYPPSRFAEAFDHLRRHNCRFTIHAGEACGLPSIREAVQLCGAHRLGHGVRIVEDITRDAAGRPVLGRLAGYVRDQRIALEVAPSSNLQTGVVPRLEDHPVDLLVRAGFRVTLNCDNRLQSRTSLSREFALCAEVFGWTLSEVRQLTLNAAKAAFLPFDRRVDLIERVILPAHAEAGLADGVAGGSVREGGWA